LLRTLAAGIDGRWSIALEIRSLPPVSIEDQRRIMQCGFEAWGRAAADQARFDTHEAHLQSHVFAKE